MARALQIYATREDWLSSLEVVEAQRPLAYTVTGLFDESVHSSFIGAVTIPDFGLALEGNEVLEPCYLVHDADAEIEIRPVLQRRDGTLYAVDQLSNRFSVGLKPGGMHGGSILISGQLGTPNENQHSRDIYRLILGQIKRRFNRIKAYWVGPSAESFLDAGGRLSVSNTPNTLLDLVR